MKKKQDNQPEIKEKTGNSLSCKNKQELIQRDIIEAKTIVIYDK